MKKDILIKVYRPSGEFLADWSDIAKFERFSKEINAGLGQCILELGVPFDYAGGELDLNNTVEISVADENTTINGWKLIYSGYISLITPYVQGKKEGITICLLGEYTRLSTDIMKTGETIVHYSDSTNGITTTAPGDEADIALIIKGILTRYRAETTSPKIFYSTANVSAFSKTASFTFNLLTYREAIDKCLSMLGSSYFWYINEFGIMIVKTIDTTPRHTFEFQKHFSEISVQRSMEKVRNNAIVWNGKPVAETEIFNGYSDLASISKYGRRTEIIIDNGITDDTSADKIGASILENNKDPNVSIVCKIIDNNENSFGYDIESIEPGDTCRFIGFNATLTDIFKDNMVITKIDYTPDNVILTVEPTKSGLVDWQDTINKKVIDITNSNVPSAYSV
jgi:hypothetical protein